MTLGERGTASYQTTRCRLGTKPPMLYYLHGKGRFTRCESRLWKTLRKRVCVQDRHVPGLVLGDFSFLDAAPKEG